MNAEDFTFTPGKDGSATSRVADGTAVSSISPPLMPEVGVLALVPDRWHWQWQPRHQVMTRLARYFTVVWMNPAEYWRKSLRLRNLLPSPDGVPIPESDFVVHTASPFLPLLYSPRKLAKYTLRKRLETARQTLIRKGCTKVALYLWRPEFA